MRGTGVLFMSSFWKVARLVRPACISTSCFYLGLVCVPKASAQCPFNWQPGDTTGVTGVTGGQGIVYASIVYDDGNGPALYIGGSFTSVSGVAANGIAKWNGSAWSALGSGVSQQVNAFTIHNGELIVGGG